MACEGDKLRSQYQFGKPFRASPRKHNTNSFNMGDRSDISMNTAPAGMYQHQNNDGGYRSKNDDIYNESEPGLPPQEDEDALHSRYTAKTMR